MKTVFVKKNRYVDSVSLMSVSAKVMESQGVTNAEAQMATAVNIALLNDLGYVLPKDVTHDDLVICITADTEENCEKARQYAMDVIDRKNVKEEQSYHSLDEIDLKEDQYDVCQISLPGEYAYNEAVKALNMGLDLFIFSDNVSLEEERKMKELGKEKGKLVMGPDAGVGLLNGTSFAAGSMNSYGPIGIVGASGSGAQEVACIIEKLGYGVTKIIGTGGRDLYPEIGGLTMLEGIKRIEEDNESKVLVLVSKLADLTVMDKVLSVADTCKKPVVAIFLGSDENLFKNHKVTPAFSLLEAGLKAVELLTGKKQTLGRTDEEIKALALEEVKKLPVQKKYFRGLYCGGTFTEEGLLYYSRNNKDVKLYSNLKNKYSTQLEDFHFSKEHTILDMGAEDFTGEAPHPVFNPELRVKRLKQELLDEEVGVVLLDFITGPGVARDPFTSHARAMKEAKDVIFIANVCGSYNDPQNIKEKVKLLQDAGAVIATSNYEAAKIASAMMDALNRRNK